jgi:DNA polymerase-3 subunit delta'
MLDLLKWCDDIASLNRENQKAYLLYCLRMVRENFMLNRQEAQLSAMSAKEREFSDKFNVFIHPDNVAQIANELNTAYYHIEANGSAKIVFLDMACKIVVLMKTQ